MPKMTESATRGQTIVTETAPDRSSYRVDAKEALMGRKMGGGPTDVSHSLSGAGKAVSYNDVPPAKRR